MQRTFSRTLYGTVAATASTLFLAAGTWSMPPVGNASKDPQRVVAYMTERLDLDAQQRESVQAVIAESIAQSDDERTRLRNLRAELRAMSAGFDADEARRLADEIGAITARLAYSMADTRAQISGLLTDEQRRELEAVVTRRENRRNHWRAPGRAGEIW